MCGNLFCHGVQPSEINRMAFPELNYWNEWYELIQEEELRQARKARGENA